jgi:phosphoserine phosphatase
MTSSGTAITATDTPSSEGNWHPDNLASMTTMLQTIAAQRPTPSPVAIFDFDNTCIFRDIGQAAFRFQIQHLRYRLSPEELAAILPQGGGELAGRPLAAIRSILVEAYRDLWPLIKAGQQLRAKDQPAYPLFAALLLWCTDMARRSDQFGPRYVLPFMGKMLAGFTTGELRQLAVEVVEQAGREPLTVETLRAEAPDPIGRIEASAPLGLHPYPEMRELMASLAELGIDRYVISASAEWLVEGAAPLLGFPIEADHIFGIRVRLGAGDRLTIADADEYPTTYRQGKTEIIRRFIKGTPVLVAGDADTDYEMLTLPGVAIRLLINRQQNGLIASLYQQPGILLQGVDLSRGCFRPSRDSISA